MLFLTARELGLPPWDAVYVRKGMERRGYLIEGDRYRYFAGEKTSV